jgi:hypothetical protein
VDEKEEKILTPQVHLKPSSPESIVNKKQQKAQNNLLV